MAKMNATWECSECGEPNAVNYDPAKLKGLVLSCYNCAKIYGTFKKDLKNQSWLVCIPFEGVGRFTPAGYVVDAGTKQALFSDPSGGGNLSRLQYAKKYGYDPLILYCNAHPEKKVCEKIKQTIANKSSLDISDLKQTILGLLNTHEEVT